MSLLEKKEAWSIPAKSKFVYYIIWAFEKKNMNFIEYDTLPCWHYIKTRYQDIKFQNLTEAQFGPNMLSYTFLEKVFN